LASIIIIPHHEATINSSAKSVLSTVEQTIRNMAHQRLRVSSGAAKRKLLFDPSTSEAQQGRTKD